MLGIIFIIICQGGDLCVLVGNLLLQLFELCNFDIVLEYYYQKDSYFVVVVFCKYVDNFILSVNQDVFFFGVMDFSIGDDLNVLDEVDSMVVFDIVSLVNGQIVMVDGIEVSW